MRLGAQRLLTVMAGRGCKCLKGGIVRFDMLDRTELSEQGSEKGSVERILRILTKRGGEGETTERVCSKKLRIFRLLQRGCRQTIRMRLWKAFFHRTVSRNRAEGSCSSEMRRQSAVRSRIEP